MKLLFLSLTSIAILAGCGTPREAPEQFTAAISEERPVPAPQVSDVQATHSVGRPGVRVILGDWMTAEKAFEAIGSAAGYPLLVHWADLDRIGLSRAEQLTTTTPSLTLEAALAIVHENGPRGNYLSNLDYRIADGILEIATSHLFDLRERELVCYDIGGMIAVQRLDRSFVTDDGRILGPTREECAREVTDIIKECVEPEGWVDNGGDAGTMRLAAGTRLIIEAPRRYHTEIRALLGRLPGEPPYRVVPVPAEPIDAKSP